MNTATIKQATFIEVSVDGQASAGPLSVPGVKAGDAICVWLNGDFTPYLENFSPVITVDDQIQQTTQRDLTGATMHFILLRLASPASA